jgi:hypothetical protein
MCSEKEKMQFELLKTFHEQFAQNQNHHQNLFIQVVSILLTVIIGFGYTLFNFKSTGDNPSFSDIGLFEFTGAFIVSEIILTLGIALVSNMALGFRRDQFINAKIREYMKVTESNDQGSLNIFPESYNPLKNYYNKFIVNNKALGLDWMPNFHFIFTTILIVMQFLLVIIYLSKLSLNQYFQSKSYFGFQYYSLLSIVGFFSVLFSLFLLKYFHRKLRAFYLVNGMQELINNRYNNGNTIK